MGRMGSWFSGATLILCRRRRNVSDIAGEASVYVDAAISEDADSRKASSAEQSSIALAVYVEPSVSQWLWIVQAAALYKESQIRLH